MIYRLIVILILLGSYAAVAQEDPPEEVNVSNFAECMQKYREIMAEDPPYGSRAYRRKQYLLDLYYQIALKMAQDEYERNRGAKPVREDAEDLFGEKIPYDPAQDGMDRRVRSLPSRELAELYIRALQERYSVTNLTVVADTRTYVEGYPLDDSRHIFDESTRVARKEQTFYQVFFNLIPDLSHDQKMAIKKMQTFDSVESLRHQVAMTLIDALKQGEAAHGEIPANHQARLEDLKDQLEKVIREFPGNDDTARKAFLTGLHQHPSRNDEFARVAGEIDFQVRYSRAVAGQDPMAYGKARMFFYMLGHYFVDAFDKEYVVWPKLVRLTDENGRTDRVVELRFYVTETQTFIKNVFLDTIPVDLVRAFNAGVSKWKHQDDRLKAELSWALQMTDRFIQVNQRFFDSKTRSRLQAAFAYIEGVAVGRYGVRANWRAHPIPASNAFVPSFKSALTVRFQNGERVEGADILRLRSMNKAQGVAIPLTVLRLRHEFRGQHAYVRIDPERNHMTTKISGTLDITEERTFVDNPYIPYGFRSQEFVNISGQLKLAIQCKLPILVGVYMEVDRDFWSD